MLLYVHFPFCRRKCAYCAFFSRELQGMEQGGAPGNRHGSSGIGDLPGTWLEVLLQELRFWAGQLRKNGERCPVETVFVGGGTPSLLEPEQIGRLLAAVREHFCLADDAEITMEANPDSLHTADRARGFLEAGINRISLGVQSLDDTELRFLGRLHSSDTVRRAVQALRQAGCTNLNIDLIWGLPGQTPEQWRRVLHNAVALEPDHVSAYGLSIEPGTPLERKNVTLPDDDVLAAMFMNGGEILEQAGLCQYEISNYARQGFRCRHNLGYWHGQEYLGLGPAAVSTVDGIRWTNPSDMEEWAQQVRSGRRSSDREYLTSGVREKEMIMLGLRTVDGLPLGLYQKETERDFLCEHGEFVAELLGHGLAVLEDGHLKLTREGMLVSNGIIEHLF